MSIIGGINNGEQGVSARTKLNEAINEANKVDNKVEKNLTAVPGNVAVWGTGGVLLDGGVTPGGGEQVNVPEWSATVVYQLGFVVEYADRLFANKVEGNLGNQPPLSGGEDAYWKEVSESQAGGTPVWQAGTFLQELAEVYYFESGKYNLYLLRAPVPFESVDFTAEVLAGSWQRVGGDGGGTTDHQDLTLESRNATGAHPNIEASVVTVNNASIARDANLQNQIFEIIETSPIDIVRFFMAELITLLGQTYNLSSETKGAVAATPITVSVTGTNRATSNRIARFIGDTPLTVERLIPAQNTQIFIRANKNNTNRLVYIYFDFYDYQEDGTTTLKGTTSDVLITNTAEVYNLLLQIAEYTASVGARSLVDGRTYQTGTGAAAQATFSIAGDYVSRFQYKLPAGSLSFLDEKLVSTQALPSLNLLSGVAQKAVNGAQNELNLEVERGIAFNGNDVILCRDYYSASTSITEVTPRGAGLVERSADNISFVTATPPFTVTGDLYWRITHTEENAFLKVKGKLL